MDTWEVERLAFEILGRAEGRRRCPLPSVPPTPHPHCHLLYPGLLCLRHQLLLWHVKVAEDRAWADEIVALSSCLPVATQISSPHLGFSSFRNGPRDQSGEVWVLGREGPAIIKCKLQPDVPPPARRSVLVTEPPLSFRPFLHRPVVTCLSCPLLRGAQTPESEPSSPGWSPSPASHLLHNLGRSTACLHHKFPQD